MTRAVVRALTRNAELQAVIAEAISDGWQAEIGGGGHIRFLHPDVPTPVFGPRTPSDHRSCKNLRSQLRRLRRQHQVPQEDTMENVEAPPTGSWRKTPEKVVKAEPEQKSPAPEPDGDLLGSNLIPTTEQVEEFCWERDGRRFTIDDVLEHFGLESTREVRRGVHNRLTAIARRKDGSTIERVERGVYIFSFDPPEEEPEEPPAAVSAPTETKVKPARLFEWVADTTDGRTIVKDDAGKVYFATFQQL